MSINYLFKNSLVRDTLIYGLTNAIYTGLPLLLLPFLIITLSPEDYGYVDLFRSISMILVPILGLSTVQSISRFYFELDSENFKKFVVSIQLFITATSLISLLIIILISDLITVRFQILLILCIINFLFGQYRESLLSVYRVSGKSKAYLGIRIFNIILELSILFILFKVLSVLDWSLRIMPVVIASFVTAILVLYQFNKLNFKLNFSKNLFKKALIFSIPLILHMLSGYILNIGDRFFIKIYLTDQDLGNYAVAYQIGMTVNFFYTSFNLAWTPTYFKWMKNGNINSIKKVRNLVYFSIPFLGFILIIAWLTVSPYFLQDSEYDISNRIVIVVLLSNVILSLYKYEANFYLYTKNTRKLSFYTTLSAIISIVFNFILIPRIGIFGAAIATLISFIVMFILVAFNRKKDEKKNKAVMV